jgi:hypothetical protein
MATKVIWEDDYRCQILGGSDHRSGWAIPQVQVSRYLESIGVKIPEMRDPKISCGICIRSWPEVVRSDG